MFVGNNKQEGPEWVGKILIYYFLFHTMDSKYKLGGSGKSNNCKWKKSEHQTLNWTKFKLCYDFVPKPDQDQNVLTLCVLIWLGQAVTQNQSNEEKVFYINQIDEEIKIYICIIFVFYTAISWKCWDSPYPTPGLRHPTLTHLSRFWYQLPGIFLHVQWFFFIYIHVFFFFSEFHPALVGLIKCNQSTLAVK